jgi:hypothetical protein
MKQGDILKPKIGAPSKMKKPFGQITSVDG